MKKFPKISVNSALCGFVGIRGRRTPFTATTGKRGNAPPSSSARKIIGLLPDQLLQTGTALKLFNLYPVFGKILGAVPIMLVLYTLLTVILWLLIYQEYRHKQLS